MDSPVGRELAGRRGRAAGESAGVRCAVRVRRAEANARGCAPRSAAGVAGRARPAEGGVCRTPELTLRRRSVWRRGGSARARVGRSHYDRATMSDHYCSRESNRIKRSTTRSCGGRSRARSARAAKRPGGRWRGEPRRRRGGPRSRCAAELRARGRWAADRPAVRPHMGGAAGGRLRRAAERSFVGRWNGWWRRRSCAERQRASRRRVRAARRGGNVQHLRVSQRRANRLRRLRCSLPRSRQSAGQLI